MRRDKLAGYLWTVCGEYIVWRHYGTLLLWDILDKLLFYIAGLGFWHLSGFCH